MVASLRVEGLAACLGQREDVQKGVVAGAPSSSQKEAVVAEGVAAGLVTLGSVQAQGQGRETALPAAPF